MSVIYLAGGCFWGVQKYFDQFEGIIKTTVGYANGHTENPKYEDVKAEKTGHVETVKVEYDENKRSLKQILDDYYRIIEPTSLRRIPPKVFRKESTRILPYWTMFLWIRG